MFNPLSLITGGLIDSVGGAIQGVTKAIWGDKESRDRYAADEARAVQETYQAELLAPEKKHIINILVDAANRLVRPLFTYGVIFLFGLAVVDPAYFALVMNSLEIIPEMLWTLFFTIVGFWFGGRLLQDVGKSRVSTAVNTEKVKAIQSMQKKFIEDKMTEDEFQKEMSDYTKPLTNAAILEWNKRRESS